MPSTDRISYDDVVAGSTEDNITTIVNRLETLIRERERQAASALADFRMTHADDEYRRVEQRWANASHETREIIHLVRTTIGKNTGTAHSAVKAVQGAIASMG